jgi:hypothetical protein
LIVLCAITGAAKSDSAAAPAANLVNIQESPS